MYCPARCTLMEETLVNKPIFIIKDSPETLGLNWVHCLNFDSCSLTQVGKVGKENGYWERVG